MARSELFGRLALLMHAFKATKLLPLTITTVSSVTDRVNDHVDVSASSVSRLASPMLYDSETIVLTPRCSMNTVTDLAPLLLLQHDSRMLSEASAYVATSLASNCRRHGPVNRTKALAIERTNKKKKC